MPKVYRNGKWYFGDKGPFDTEAQVDLVIAAMYANGYKGDTDGKRNRKHETKG